MKFESNDDDGIHRGDASGIVYLRVHKWRQQCFKNDQGCVSH